MTQTLRIRYLNPIAYNLPFFPAGSEFRRRFREGSVFHAAVDNLVEKKAAGPENHIAATDLLRFAHGFSKVHPWHPTY